MSVSFSSLLLRCSASSVRWPSSHCDELLATTLGDAFTTVDTVIAPSASMSADVSAVSLPMRDVAELVSISIATPAAN